MSTKSILPAAASRLRRKLTSFMHNEHSPSYSILISHPGFQVPARGAHVHCVVSQVAPAAKQPNKVYWKGVGCSPSDGADVETAAVDAEAAGLLLVARKCLACTVGARCMAAARLICIMLACPGRERQRACCQHMWELALGKPSVVGECYALTRICLAT